MTQSKMLPPAYFLIFIVIMWLFSVLLPVKKVIPTPWNMMGVVLVFDGLGTIIWSAWMFRLRETTIKPDEDSSVLVTEGPYMVSRNPMYLGMTEILLGLALFLGALTPLFFPPVFFQIIEKFFVVPEEKKLERLFGDMYLAYKSRVKRWIFW